MASKQSSAPIPSSSSSRPLGAVPVRNEKGEITMQKVKVQRYVTGRKPKFLNETKIYSDESDGSDDRRSDNQSDDDSDDDEFNRKDRKILPSLKDRHHGSLAFTLSSNNADKTTQDDDSDDDDDDVRLRMRRKQPPIELDEEKLSQDPRQRRLQQYRQTIEPKVIEQHSNDQQQSADHELEQDDDGDIIARRRRHRHREVIDAEDDNEDKDEDVDDDDIEHRHALLKQRMTQLELEAKDNQDPGIEDLEDADGDDSDDDESEFESEEYSEDEALPRLKPIFVSKKDRITINEKEAAERQRAQLAEQQAKLAHEERRRTTLKMIENDRRQEEIEREKNKSQAEEESIIAGIAAIVTDDEDDETAFELWKVRELRRIKREKEEEEQRDRERREIERLRSMTEEERQEELKRNPRIVTNQQKKGKYKYLQKYYHRGAFYLDTEDQVFQRDFAQPTLDDHFDKSNLPSVMQVKNFGRAGRTKYTHLTDVDTTAFDSAWSAKDNVHAIQFHQSHGGGMKQSFERPGKRKK